MYVGCYARSVGGKGDGMKNGYYTWDGQTVVVINNRAWDVDGASAVPVELIDSSTFRGNEETDNYELLSIAESQGFFHDEM